MPSTAAVRKTTFLISALSILPHIFCCGIPAVMAIISLGTTVGLAGVLATNPFYQVVDKYHEILISIAVASVLLGGILNFVAYRIDCRTAALSACDHASCAPKKTNSLKVFLLSLGLLTLDLSWFATEKFELGLHQSPAVSAAQQ
ncbi:MAG: hypothetical protein GC129_06115 [Proteobacteria bacterium]|nr:hypothetical protein [Pseudomonadota bacterium]